MTREENAKIVDKVKVYRQNFTITDLVYQEWFKVLGPYEYYDVSEKLDKYLKDLDNEGKIPNPYYLIKYLKTNREKQNAGIVKIECPLCGCCMDVEDLEGKHYDRCLSTRYIITMRKKYFDKETDVEILSELSDEVFWDKYYEFVNILSKKNCIQEKNTILNILEKQDQHRNIKQITLRM